MSGAVTLDAGPLIALDRVDATSVGRLLASSRTSEVVEAHVVICARRAGQAIATSDQGDLGLLDPTTRATAVQLRADLMSLDSQSALVASGDEVGLGFEVAIAPLAEGSASEGQAL